MWSGIQGEIIDLELNQESSESPGLIEEVSPWSDEPESSNEQIEGRFRQLESIISRFREREMSRTSERETVPLVVEEHPEDTAGYIHERSRESLIENGTVDKTDRTYLIAKALGMEKTTTSVASSYFDCNICLERAVDPVLTCCGHLYCWPCFYKLPFSYLNVKECPVCDGEVTDSEVVPIYGNGNESDVTKPKSKDSGIIIPPRPCAKRVEYVRPPPTVTRTTIPLSLLPTQTLHQIRMAIDAIEQRILPLAANTRGTNTTTNRSRRNQPRRSRSSMPLRVIPLLSPPDASVDSLEHPIGAFDTSVETSNSRRNRRRSSRIAERNAHQNTRSSETAPHILLLLPGPSSLPRELAVSESPTEMTTNAPEMDPSVASTSSSRRRTEAPDVVDGSRTRSRRRRLR